MREIKDSPRSQVRIGYDGRVHKTFRGKGAEERFVNEVRILNILQERGCDYVPKIIESDPEKLYLVTTNCGQIVNKMNQDRVDQIFADLETEFGIRHCDPFLRNITYRMQDGRFCVIDFELADDVRSGEKSEASSGLDKAKQEQETSA